ncbi:outer membrane protein assembly factor BamD [Treponema sp. OMZ 791]|uniref:outer membrane protein assembly factor BamD n=1 Tax=unclassified Treponema TaxID=2638727 RepID=UPI0021FBC66E|nr:outer membrane protein assembly factor BamD [Treponema sp. OMZ 789]UTC71187.1 outer membrane protein assembly factor BamD [Treponema sp. OMZ 790]UTC73904.1 outer membrane protein assembly factor BamD [Treponema sp. OMZ 791]
MRFILVLFLIFILFNSCASTKKSSGENPAEIKKTEDVVPNDSKPEPAQDIENKDAEKIVIEDNHLQDKNSEQDKSSEQNEVKVEADSEKSVSDPKPVSDKPALELIIDTEDEPALPNNKSLDSSSMVESPAPVKKTETKEPPAPAKKAEIKEPPASAKKTDTKTMEPVPADKPAVNTPNTPSKAKSETVQSAEKEKDKLKPADDSNKTIVPDDNSDKNLVNEEKMKEIEPARVFSEFPSTEPDETKEEKTSRSVKLYTGQRLEVVYPGEGWVYLGESSAQKGIKYQQRKLQNGTSIFHFGALNEGNYILNFSHFDVFSDNFISDSIAVHVEKAKTKLNDTVKAPDYKGSVNIAKLKPAEKKPEKDTSDSSKPMQGVPIQKESSSIKKDTGDLKVYDSPDLLTVTEKPESKTDEKKIKSPSELLDMIRGYISAGNSAEALNSVDSFLKDYSVNLDEALFLRGQAYELNGPNKNVKKALEAYQTLTKAYPESKFWDKADARIRYIKKFYIDIK